MNEESVPSRTPLRVLVSIFLLCTVLLALRAEMVRNTPLRAEAGDVYLATVNQLLSSGRLRYDPAATDRDAQLLLDRRPSDLRKRMAFVDSDRTNPELWPDDGQRLVARHDLKDPLDTRGHWRGALLFGQVEKRDDPGILLQQVSDAGREAIAPDMVIEGDPLFRLDPYALNAPNVALSSAVRRRVTSEESMPELDTVRRGPMIEIFCDGEIAARVLGIGKDQVAVETLSPESPSPCSVRVDQRRLGGDCGDASPFCRFRVLAPGSVLRFERGNRVVAEYRRRSNETSADKLAWRGLNGKLRFDEDSGAFASIVAKTMALQPCMRDKCFESRELSLDEQLQHAADKEARGITYDPATRKARTDSAAAIAIVNARSGEVLALAGAGEENDACEFPGLCRYPIGSTAKPLFAIAIGAARRDLLGLEVKLETGERTSIAGLVLPPVNNLNKNSGGDGYVNFTEFLEYSDNFYAETLLLLASTARDGTSCQIETDDAYRIVRRDGDGHVVSAAVERNRGGRPRSAFETRDCKVFPENRWRATRYDSPWTNMLGDLFDVTPGGLDHLAIGRCDLPGYVGDKYHDATPWAALTDPCRMLRASPEREFFRIDTAHDFRTGMTPLVLGDGSGKWSVVKAAQGYSRLVTGTGVRASFLKVRADAAAPDPLRAELDRRRCRELDQLCDSPRGAVLRGLALGPVSGTSKALRPQLDRLRADVEKSRRFTLRAYAKTGTMIVPDQFAGACRRAGLARKNCNGKALAIVLAVYPYRFGGAAPAEESLWARTPRCALTIFVNLPQYHRGDEGAAMGVAGRLIDVAKTRLTQFGPGEYCGGN